MQIIPLKTKYQLTEDDINNLSAWMVDGHTLADICAHFEAKLSEEKVFILAGVIAREMFDMSLQELCPELVAERRRMSSERVPEWQAKKTGQQLTRMIRELLEDLMLLEMELLTVARQKA
jgi:hypothetical protein